MPRKPRPWFRVYVEMMSDPKVRSLSDTGFRLWVGILALARRSPTPGVLMLTENLKLNEKQIADFCGISLKKVRQQLPILEDEIGLIERVDESAPYKVTRWSERQFESDDVTERTRSHRSNEQDRNVPTSAQRANVGTPPESEDREQIKATTRAQPENADSGGIASDAPSLTAGDDEEDHIEELRAKANEPLLGFEEFWDVYPKRNGRKIGRGLCEKRWRKLSLDDRRAAWRGARNYAVDVSAGLQIAKDPDRWLRDRIWESFDGPARVADAATFTSQEVPYDPDDDWRHSA